MDNLVLIRLENESGSPYGYEAYEIPQDVYEDALIEYLKTVSLSWRYAQEDGEWFIVATENQKGSLISRKEAEELSESENDSVYNQFRIRPVGSWPTEIYELSFWQ